MSSYSAGDKLLVEHDLQLYPAKVMAVDSDKGLLLHYEGWNKKWDEWGVPDTRLYVDNEENRKLADKRKVEHMAKVEKGSRPKLHGPPGKRHKKDNEDDDDDFSSADIKLILTDELKNVVVRDWENLTQKSFLLDLPKKPERTVNKIMSDFLAKKKDPVVMNQICQGLLVYFDRALPTILLYTVERAQYQKLREEFPLKRMCEIYGGEHLLRLFVRMPQLLTNTDLDETEIKQLITKLVELVKFLSKNASEYFSDDEGSGIYVPAAAASTTGSAAAATGAAAAKE